MTCPDNEAYYTSLINGNLPELSKQWAPIIKYQMAAYSLTFGAA